VPLLKIPSRAYARLATLLGFPGTEGIVGIQDEAVPTQDLSRVFQDTRIKRTVYKLLTNPAADDTVDASLSTVSEWEEVLVDGVEVAANADLPQRFLDDRIIVDIGLQVFGTRADYTRASVSRMIQTSPASSSQLREFGAIATGLIEPTVQPFNPLPVYINFRDFDLRFVQIVSGNAADFAWTIHMVSAPRGILHPYPGV